MLRMLIVITATIVQAASFHTSGLLSFVEGGCQKSELIVCNSRACVLAPAFHRRPFARLPVQRRVSKPQCTTFLASSEIVLLLVSLLRVLFTLHQTAIPSCARMVNMVCSLEHTVLSEELVHGVLYLHGGTIDAG